MKSAPSDLPEWIRPSSRESRKVQSSKFAQGIQNRSMSIFEHIPNSDLENETLIPLCHCESRQKREKVRGNLIVKTEIASLHSQ